MQASGTLAKRQQWIGERRMAHAYLMEPQAAELFLKIGEPATFRKNTVLFEGNSTPDRCFYARRICHGHDRHAGRRAAFFRHV